MASRSILYDVQDRIARITLNRPDKRNALDDGMVADLTAAVGAAGRDPAVRIVILRGTGEAFCAGVDLAHLSRVASYDLEANREDSRRLAHLFRLMYELRKPVIADVRGPALAGGCGLATACDFIFAARESARFGYPEVRIGFVPAIVAPFLARRVGEGRAREIMLRGDVVDAVTAASIGLVTAALPAAEMDGVILSLAEELIRRNSGTAMGLCKELLARIQGMNVPEGLEYAANINAAARMTDDCKRGVAAFLKKEQVEW